MSAPVPEEGGHRVPTERADVAATFCATLVDEWVRCGITDAVVAPGSRSTPMAVALASHPNLAVHVHHDERSAAFIALGLGMASGRPALVLTTSGTAAVELHPAIVEAHQAGVPLIALTADRPPELREVGAPQTVDQAHLYGRAVRWFTDPGVPDGAAWSSWRSLAARAVAEATTGPGGAGPVHLNLPFREPLLGTVGNLPPARPGAGRWHTTDGASAGAVLDGQAIDRLTELLDAEQGVIVAGRDADDVGAVLALARAARWPVLADPPSSCRLPDPAVVGAFDAILRHDSTAATLRPDVVLRLGAQPASKALSLWLAASDARQVVVDAHGRWFDPDHTADQVLHADPGAVARTLAGRAGDARYWPVGVIRPGPHAERPRFREPWDDDAAGSPWMQAWQRAEAAAQEAIDLTLVAHAESTEPAVARTVLAGLPDGSNLVVSSSMPVRDVEWYGAPRYGVRVLANRGANGIDGVVSTAVGVALAARGTGSPTVALVGDVAFLHDTNALLGVAARGIDLTVVVVDNDGGGIFSFLPQATALAADQFEQLFGTPHGVDLRVLAAAHGLVTIEPTGSADIGPAVAASVDAGGVRIVLVRTDRAVNVAVHDEIHAAVAAALDTPEH